MILDLGMSLYLWALHLYVFFLNATILYIIINPLIAACPMIY